MHWRQMEGKSKISDVMPIRMPIQILGMTSEILGGTMWTQPKQHI